MLAVRIARVRGRGKLLAVWSRCLRPVRHSEHFTVGEEDAQICFHTARSASERKTAMSDLPSSRHRQQSSSYPLIRTPPLARTRFVEKRHRSARLRIAEVMSHQMQVLGVFWGLFRCGAELARVSPPAVIICCRLHAVTLLWRSARELWPSGWHNPAEGPERGPFIKVILLQRGQCITAGLFPADCMVIVQWKHPFCFISVSFRKTCFRFID